MLSPCEKNNSDTSKNS